MTTRDADRTDRVSDLWSLGVLPILAAGSLSGFLGLAWDISWHIDKGRDTFFTPPHDFLYTGLATVLIAAAYGLWQDRRDTPFHLRAGAYRLHPGLLIVGAAALLILAFAPLDDLWHRLFGRDVTLWGPMHLIGLLGMAGGRFGGLVCAWIERGLARDMRRRRLFELLALYFAVLLLAGLVAVTAEYEFVVPQFPMIFHPMLLPALSVFPLVLIAGLAPRAYPATVVTLAYTALRFGLSGWLTAAAQFDLAGVSHPAIPLLIPAGIAVDLLALGRTAGWVSGLVAGAVTLAANLIMIDAIAPAAGIRLFWTAGVFARALAPALALSALAGAAAAAVAAVLAAEPTRILRAPAAAPAGHTHMTGDIALPRGMPSRATRVTWVSVFVTVVFAATVAAATAAVRAAVVPPPPRPAVTGRITVAHAAGGLPSLVTIAVFPAGAPRGSELLFSIFQPGGGAVNRRVLEPASPGVYREEYRFPAPGAYGFYMRFGAGQSGFVAAGAIGIGAAPGTLDEVTTRFRSGLRKAPGYVQPLGYTIFGLIAALAIAGMAAVLARIRGTLSA